jgi:hypothetical protein
MSNPRHWMQTYTGRPFRFDDLSDLQLDIRDIARPLSRLPRFGGHTSHPISVAEHSVVVSQILRAWNQPNIVQLHGLMHDAHEAFTGDIVAPLKRFLHDTMNFDISSLQDSIQNAIHQAFNIPDLELEIQEVRIHNADLYACKLERNLVMKSSLEWDIDQIEIDQEHLTLYSYHTPLEAFTKFSGLFKYLMEHINADR